MGDSENNPTVLWSLLEAAAIADPFQLTPSQVVRERDLVREALRAALGAHGSIFRPGGQVRAFQ
jgi:hypothetical protein